MYATTTNKMKRLGIALVLLSLIMTLRAENQAQTLTHPWAGARIGYIGDSITDPNVRQGDMKHYWGWLEQWLGTTTYNYSVSGFTLQNGLGSVDKLYKEHGQEVDAILVFLGTNDYNSSVPLGEFFSYREEEVEVATGQPRHLEKRLRRQPILSQETVKGRLNLLIQKLKQLYPTKQIVLMTPLHRGYATFGDKNIQPDESYPNAQGYYIHDLVEAVRQAGQLWSVPVIDLFSLSGLMPSLPEHSQYFMNPEHDRLHPNGAGHERLARTIMQQTLLLPLF